MVAKGLCSMACSTMVIRGSEAAGCSALGGWNEPLLLGLRCRCNELWGPRAITSPVQQEPSRLPCPQYAARTRPVRGLGNWPFRRRPAGKYFLTGSKLCIGLLLFRQMPAVSALRKKCGSFSCKAGYQFLTCVCQRGVVSTVQLTLHRRRGTPARATWMPHLAGLDRTAS
jgi:hypothetical protein